MNTRISDIMRPVFIWVFALVIFFDVYGQGSNKQTQGYLQKNKKVKVLMLIADGFNATEFWEPYLTFYAMGCDVQVAAPEKGRVKTGNILPGDDDPINDWKGPILPLENIDISSFQALVIGGGHGAEKLINFPSAISLVKKFAETGKPVAGVCKGPMLMAKAGLLKDKNSTFLFSLKDYMVNDWLTGNMGKYHDVPVIVDSNLITSRYEMDNHLLVNETFKKLQASAGFIWEKKNAKVVIVNPGAHVLHKYAFNEACLEPLCIERTNLTEDKLKDWASQGKRDEFQAIIFADGKDKDTYLTNSDFAKILKANPQWKVLAMGSTFDALAKINGKRNVVKIEGSFPDQFQKLVASISVQTPKPESISPFSAALCVEPGFDEEVYFAMKFFLESKGKKVAVLSSKLGYVKSLSGAEVLVTNRYVDSVRWSSNPQIVSVGGLRPESENNLTDKTSNIYESMLTAGDKMTERDAFLVTQFQNGARLVVFGFDVITLSKNMAELNGKSVATSDQARWSLRGKKYSSKYSENQSVLSLPGLITAKGPSALVEVSSLMNKEF